MIDGDVRRRNDGLHRREKQDYQFAAPCLKSRWMLRDLGLRTSPSREAS